MKKYVTPKIRIRIFIGSINTAGASDTPAPGGPSYKSLKEIKQYRFD